MTGFESNRSRSTKTVDYLVLMLVSGACSVVLGTAPAGLSAHGAGSASISVHTSARTQAGIPLIVQSEHRATGRRTPKTYTKTAKL